MTQLWQQSAACLQQLIATGQVSSLEVVESHLDRMAAVNDKLNAVTVDLSEAALKEARRADARLSAGDPVGPLHGVPVVIKENVDQVGHSTTNGVAAFENLIAEDDSPVVANLRKAGAVIIGRTNTPEFSLRWFTDNPLHGLTLNPWNPGITCGGSSGGTASAVAAGIAPVGHGNDLGGSLRYPAYCCGLATVRPSLGRVPAYNASGPERPPAINLMSVQGPIARDVADVRLTLSAMAGADWRDPLWKPVDIGSATWHESGPVAVCAQSGRESVHPEVVAAVQRAADALSNAGYRVEEVRPPEVEAIAEQWGNLITTEIRVLMDKQIKAHGSDKIRSVLEFLFGRFQTLDAAGYMQALMSRNHFVRVWFQFMEQYPLVLMPVSEQPPFPVGFDVENHETMAEVLRASRPMYVVNLLGLPAAAVPTGLSDGIPMGVQIVGPRYREDLCLDGAQQIEQSLGVLSHELWQSE